MPWQPCRGLSWRITMYPRIGMVPAYWYATRRCAVAAQNGDAEVTSQDREADSIALLRPGCRGLLVIVFQASNNVSSPISGQDLRNIGLETAFELFDLLGAALFRWHRVLPEPHHSNWCAIGFELQFILFAICIYRSTGNTGNRTRREVSNLLT